MGKPQTLLSRVTELLQYKSNFSSSKRLWGNIRVVGRFKGCRKWEHGQNHVKGALQGHQGTAQRAPSLGVLGEAGTADTV